MLKCIWLRKKLYDYVDNALNENERVKLANHLESCADCRHRAEDIRGILGVAQSMNTPQPSEEFWHNFQSELDHKLNDQLVPSREERLAVSRKLRPALAFTMLSMLILVFTFGVFTRTAKLPRLAQEDKALIEEISSLDDSDQEQLFDDTQSLIEMPLES